jgi:hypothetical protein
MERVRALRSYAAERYMLATTQLSLFDPHALAAGTLEECITKLESNTGGVWCYGAAVLLAKICAAAEIPCLIHQYGLPNPLYAHVVNLVEVEGHLYMQDAYFDAEYVDAAGQPVPYCDQLAALAERKPTRIRQSSAFRRCIFKDARNIADWVDPVDQALVVHTQAAMPGCPTARLGIAPIRIEVFQKRWYKTEESLDWLAARALPRDLAYTQLFPKNAASGPEGQRVHEFAREICSRLISPSMRPNPCL